MWWLCYYETIHYLYVGYDDVTLYVYLYVRCCTGAPVIWLRDMDWLYVSDWRCNAFNSWCKRRILASYGRPLWTYRVTYNVVECSQWHAFLFTTRCSISDLQRVVDRLSVINDWHIVSPPRPLTLQRVVESSTTRCTLHGTSTTAFWLNSSQRRSTLSVYVRTSLAYSPDSVV